MKKRRKGNLLKQMMAVFLTAVLIAGMVAGTVPAEVFAKENTEISESVSGNTTEPIEEETASEPVAEPIEEEAALEPVADPADGNIASGTDWVLDGNGVLTIKSNDGMSDWTQNMVTYKSQVKQAVIQSGVTSIENYAFNGCSNLESIEIPPGVTKIGSFNDCSSLESIEIPSGVTEIETAAFIGCTSLKSIEIPSSVTRIGAYAFDDCSSLESIEIPSAVTGIGQFAFVNCSSLKSIEIPFGVTKIDIATFAGCTSLKSIEMPSGMLTIESLAFENCSSLESIEIPSGMLAIRDGAFRNCINLTSVTMLGTIPPTLSEGTYKVFESCKFVTDGIQGIRVPAGCEAAYKEAWTNWTDDIEQDAHTHTFSTEWSHDDSSHWHECSCGAKADESAHSFSDWTITKAATEEEEGSRERNCSICGYKQTEVIPKTDGSSSDSGSNTDNSNDSSNTGNGNDSSNNGSDKKDDEPKTGDTTPIEIYATLAMTAGLSYLILLFGNRKRGMTEQKKKELTAALVAWGRKGGKLRKAAALASIFLILVYYHSIGKKICVDWKAVYGE